MHAEDVVDRARQVALLLRSRADQTEQIGTMAPEVVAGLREAGLFGFLMPAEVGGLATDLLTAIEIIEILSRADGSSGWTLMANGLAGALAAAYCDDQAVAKIFVNGSTTTVAGMLGPGGKCQEVAGGYRGSGTYRFGSGAGHADWLAAGMLVIEDGKPRPLPSGQPEVRVCFIPRDAVEFTGNWDVMGLVGTGSYDYVVPDQFVDAGYTFERTSVEYRRGGPVFALGVAGLACAGHAAVALGIAARALEEIAELASHKQRAAYPSAVGDHPVYLHGFSLQEASYQAARAYTRQVFGSAAADLRAGRQLTAGRRQRFRQCVTYVHGVTAEVVRWCYTWGGSDALRMPSALGRCWRDISGATQHVFVDPINLVDAGPDLIEAWRSGTRDEAQPRWS